MIRLDALARRCAVAAALLAATPAAAQFAVTTHHYDAGRTGWNPQETALTWQSVANQTGPTAFGLLASVALDAQVDAQPLVMPNAIVAGDPNPGTHDVAFVVTEANTVYAIDPGRGTILNSRNLGPAVPTPLGCNNSAATVGVTGTPVIDPATNSLYLIAYTQTGSGSPVYTLHRLALQDFSDVTPPQTVSAAQTVGVRARLTFDARYQRQRAALLLNNGAVYAAFASFCDFVPGRSRGWLLGWNAATLKPLTVNSQPGTMVSLLPDSLTTEPDNYYLSSIWMSGAGPAADSAGNLYVVTGNSDPSGTSYNSLTNLSESLIRFNPASNSVTGYFTPYDVALLDAEDADFGSGGVLLLPSPIAGLPPNLAAAMGKDGWLFLLNRDSLGGYAGPSGPDQALGRIQTGGGCWCMPSYFNAAGPMLAGSAGRGVRLVTLSGPPGAALALRAYAPIQTGQDGGFFTTVSSNGTSNPIIWAVSRPVDASPANVRLYALQALPQGSSHALTLLYQGVAGTWPHTSGNANIVPVVANGRVYVASDRQLAVFGLGQSGP